MFGRGKQRFAFGGVRPAGTLLPCLLFLAALGCASVPVPGPVLEPPSVAATPPATVEAARELELRALLLLLADSRTFEAYTLGEALEGGPEMRWQLALALLRIGDPRGGPLLEALLGDSEPRVRRAAAFALGRLTAVAYPAGAAALWRSLLDPDRETGRRAVEGLAETGAPLGDVVEKLLELPAEELLARLLPSLHRFGEAGVLRWAEAGLDSEDPRLRLSAAYALARDPRPAALERLRELMAAPEPRIHAWAARALGKVGEREDLARLGPLLDQEEAGPLVQALGAARALVAAGVAAPPEPWVGRLLELFEDPRPGVRASAMAAAAAWLLDEELEAALETKAASGAPWERRAAVLALAAGESPRARGTVLHLSASEEASDRAAAAAAAGRLGSLEVLEVLAEDPAPAVRRAVLEARLAGRRERAAAAARAALADEDPSLRATAFGWAVEYPLFSVDRILAALAAGERDRIPDARLAGLAALAARAEAEPLERQRAIEALLAFSRSEEVPTRRQVARHLAALGQPAPPAATPRPRRGVAAYRDIARRTGTPRRLEIETERGSLEVELACPEAPMTCLSFLQLAGQGFYDGLTFHRVVPDFVAQAGDPRGDGWGGPGYSIRDEPNMLPFERGTLGIALSGPETGGSQFFVTLAPQPHLEREHTAFGRVVAGEEVLDRIAPGDRILGIREKPAG